MSKRDFLRWLLGLGIANLVTVVPWVYYRWAYTHGKRLREVDPGKLYRSGQMTRAGFTEAVARYGIRTIVNLQDEYPDPNIDNSFFDRGAIKESDLCRLLGVRYVYLPPDLVPRRQFPAHRPEAVDKFLAILDDAANYPVLIHCRAGLHRTGVLAAIYRMEYQGWSPHHALSELKDNGFGEYAAVPSNEYIRQYVLQYQPGKRLEATGQ